jgi:large subunit ribosomal protein L4
MKIEVRKIDGSAANKKADFKKEIFGITPNKHVIYLAVKAEMANQRQGTASTKTRGEVRGSGAKLFRQKGTGRARVGDAQSPIRQGGGVAFGPKPRDYRSKINRKVRTLARKSILASMVKNDRVIVVDEFNLESHKTKFMQAAIDALGLSGKKVTILPAEPTDNLWLASRNLPFVHVRPAAQVSAYDLWSTDYLLFDGAGVKELTAALSK